MAMNSVNHYKTATGTILPGTNLATLLSGEDETNDVFKVEQQFEYETVAVSQTDQILGATGAVGDLLHKVVCVVATAANSEVLIQDGSDTAITLLENAVGEGIGTYVFELNIHSTDATTPGWKITTASGVTVIGIGRFT